MKAATKTRTQRRMEKKQALILLVLVLVVSLASFTLGVIVGQRGAERDFVQQTAPDKVIVAKVPARSEPLQDEAAAAEKAEQPVVEQPVAETKLTFYDDLAKESSAPLGSGINLPPQEKKPQPVNKPPIKLPEQPIVKRPATKVAAVNPASSGQQPKVSSQGSYSVQIGSFSTAADAGKLKQRMQAKEYPAFIVEADLGSKGIWYRVKLGPYADGVAAKQMQLLVEEKDKIKGFISRQ